MKANYMGHKANDLSGQNALIFEKQFREANTTFLETRNVTFENPVLLRDQIAKILKQ